MPRMCWRQRSDGRELGGVLLPVRLIGLADRAKRTKENRISACAGDGPGSPERVNATDRFSRNQRIGPTEIRYVGGWCQAQGTCDFIGSLLFLIRYDALAILISNPDFLKTPPSDRPKFDTGAWHMSHGRCDSTGSLLLVVRSSRSLFEISTPIFSKFCPRTDRIIAVP